MGAAFFVDFANSDDLDVALMEQFGNVVVVRHFAAADDGDGEAFERRRSFHRRGVRGVAAVHRERGGGDGSGCASEELTAIEGAGHAESSDGGRGLAGSGVS